MKQYISHFTFAFRILAKTPTISILSIMVLSVSIALVTVMFNTTESVLFSELPYEGGERLMAIERENPANQYADRGIPFASYNAFVEQQRALEGVIGVFNDGLNIQNGNEVGQENAAFISPGFMTLLGVTPLLGRDFHESDADPESPPVMIISHQVWTKYFSQDPEVIGRAVMADGISRTIIGVAPEGFDFPFVQRAWVPLNTDTLVGMTGWGSSVFVMGKLRADLDRASAIEQVKETYARIMEQFPVENEGVASVRVRHFKELFLDGETRMFFVAMAICAILVLFMGCAIVSNLITVRSVKRSNELAIRSALGASRFQIVLQMLFESFITSTLSLAIGWLLMEWFSTAVLGQYFNQFRVPSWFFGDGYNAHHYLFVAGVLLVATLTSSLIPALRASKTSLNDLLKDSSRTGSSLKMTLLGRLLIIFQIAAACSVVTGGAIVGYFLHELALDETDYNPDQYLYASLGMDARSHSEAADRVQLMRNLKQAMEAHPEVESMAYSTQFYVNGLIEPLWNAEVSYPSPDAHPQFYRWVVSPGYFETMNIPLIAGRAFTELDDLDRPLVVILTDVTARELFGDEDPIGKQIVTGGTSTRTGTVIGMVKDVFRSHQDRDRRSGYLMSAYQEVWMDAGIHIHTRGNPIAVEQALVQNLNAIDSRATINMISTIRERYEQGLVGLRFIFVLFATFSIGALLMAASGLYGVVSFSVSQQIRQIGIRLALGAAPLQIITRVFRQGMVNTAIGMVAGVGLALGLRHVLAIVLNPLQESIVVYAGVLAAILLLSAIAIFVPAVQGGTTDPAEALRVD